MICVYYYSNSVLIYAVLVQRIWKINVLFFLCAENYLISTFSASNIMFLLYSFNIPCNNFSFNLLLSTLHYYVYLVVSVTALIFFYIFTQLKLQLCSAKQCLPFSLANQWLTYLYVSRHYAKIL